MPNFVNNTITVQGEGQIAAAMAGTQMVITRVQVGSGVASVPLPSLTTLVTPIMNLTPQPPQVSANNLQTGEIVVMAVLDTANVTTTFGLAELGVFATSGGGPEQLIAYCQCSAPFDSIAPGSGQNRLQLNLQVPIVVGPGASVSITVQAGNPVYVPPVVAGPGIIVTAPTNSQGQVIEWIVSTPQITQNTTLYVANEYTQNVAPYFSSLANAFAYLNSFVIASGVQVSISMSAEQFNISTTNYLNHANASQIVIQGVVNPDVTFSGVGSITGSAGNWKVQLTGVSSTAHIQIGTWLDIWNVAWNWQCPLVGGCFQVTAVSGSTVTIQSYYYNSAWPSMAGTSGTMTPLTTVINMTSSLGLTGIDLGNGIGTMRNIAIINAGGQSNNYAAAGLLLSKGSGIFNRMGFWGFRSNTTLSHGAIVGGPANGIFQCCGSSLNDNGFTCSGGGANLQLQSCCTTHNMQRGVWTEGNGTFIVCLSVAANQPTFAAGNRERGLLINDSSYFAIIGAYLNGQPVYQPVMSSYNASYGCHMSSMSKMVFSNSSTVLYAAFNGTYDVALSAISLAANSSLIQGTRKFNGTPGILTADGCLFQ
jgi:hypothetical protein